MLEWFSIEAMLPPICPLLDLVYKKKGVERVDLGWVGDKMRSIWFLLQYLLVRDPFTDIKLDVWMIGLLLHYGLFYMFPTLQLVA